MLLHVRYDGDSAPLRAWPCRRADWACRSRRQQPQDFVSPRFRFLRYTVTRLPRSHRQITRRWPRPNTLAIIVSRPNLMLLFCGARFTSGDYFPVLHTRAKNKVRVAGWLNVGIKSTGNSWVRRARHCGKSGCLSTAAKTSITAAISHVLIKGMRVRIVAGVYDLVSTKTRT